MLKVLVCECVLCFAACWQLATQLERKQKQQHSSLHHFPQRRTLLLTIRNIKNVLQRNRADSNEAHKASTPTIRNIESEPNLGSK